MIEENLDLIGRVIGTRWRTHRDLDDLEQAGAVGYLQAAQRFDPSRGTHFRSFAARRIAGAALDWLKAENQQRRGEVPLEVELVGGNDGFEDLTANDVREELLRPLPERTRLMAELYFFEGHTLREVADRFRITETRVSQLLKHVRRRLRELLCG